MLNSGSRGIRCLALAAILIICTSYGAISVRATFVSLVVYQHGFAKGFNQHVRSGNPIPINKTSTFTQDDIEVYAYLSAAFYAVNFTFEWYTPQGQLYANRSELVTCVETPCTVTSNLYIGSSSSANTMFGTWSLSVLAEGNPLYTDFFELQPVVKELDHWDFDILQSAPPRIQGRLTITIHPTNQTWVSYSMFMPYADNVSAYDLATSKPLQVLIQEDRSQHEYYTVEFGVPRTEGFTFVLSFDATNIVHTLTGWLGGQFALTWAEYPYERFSYNPVPESYSVKLPSGGQFIDVVGLNLVPLIQSLNSRSVISFNSSFINNVIQWTVIYQDFTYRNAHASNSTGSGSPFRIQIMIPYLPISLRDLNLWAAVMAVFLLTASEVASPLYTRSGISLLIDRKRLRLVALALVLLFLVTAVYQLLPSLAGPH